MWFIVKRPGVVAPGPLLLQMFLISQVLDCNLFLYR